MKDAEKRALQVTLKDAGIHRQTKNFGSVSLTTFRHMKKAIKAKVTAVDLMTEYELNLSLEEMRRPSA